MIDIENRDDIYTWEGETLWNAFNILLEKEDEDGKRLLAKYNKEFQKVKYGIRIKALIHYLIKPGWNELHPETHKARILGMGKYNLEEYLEEKEERERIMRQIILDNTGEEELTSPRGDQ